VQRMNGYNRGKRNFPWLRRRLDALERDVYETDVLIKMTRNSKDPDREEAIQNYHIENAERQAEIEELRLVLYRSAWPVELKVALIVITSVVLLLAALATVRTF
jgi:hypothetical protein